MAYKGTFVTYGRGTGIVTSTGMNTELGKIATMLQDEEEVKTPLQKRLLSFGKKLAFAILAICAIVFIAGILRGEAPLLMVCQQVSALEGLESKIGSDQISVFGYFMTGLALSNDAETDGENNIIGDPTETALYTAAKLNGFDKKELEKNFPRVAEIPFNSDRKCMTTFHKWQASSSEPEDKVAFISFTKGALDVLIEKSVDVLTSKGVTAVDIGEINKINDAMAADGMRVLCLCIRKWAALPDDLVPENVDNIRKFIKYIMTINELLFTLALSSVVFIAVEIEKFIKRKKSLNVF